MKFIKYTGLEKLPTKMHVSDAGYDCYLPNTVYIQPRAVKVIPLYFGIELKLNECAIICLRSSYAAKNLIANNPPIDCGYTGSCHLIIHNLSNEPVLLERGARVCQLVIFKIPKALCRSKRGLKAFGSSGK